MPPVTPIEFVRQLANGRLQRCGNQVQIEGSDGDALSITNPLFVTDTWRVEQIEDETANDNDKTIYTCLTGEEMQVLFVWVAYNSDGNAGDRQLVLQVLNSDNNVIHEARAGTTQAASLTRYYNFGASLADLTDFRDTDHLTTPLPPGLMLQAGDYIRIYDNNGVSAGDDMYVRLQYAEREI